MAPLSQKAISFLRRCAAGGRGLIPVREVVAEIAPRLGWKVSPVDLPCPVSSVGGDREFVHRLVERRLSKLLGPLAWSVAAPIGGGAAFVVIPLPPVGRGVPSAPPAARLAAARRAAGCLADACRVVSSEPASIGPGEVVLGRVDVVDDVVRVRRAWFGNPAWLFSAPGRGSCALWRLFTYDRVRLPHDPYDDPRPGAGEPAEIVRRDAGYWWTWAYEAGLRQGAAELLAAHDAARLPAPKRVSRRAWDGAAYCTVTCPELVIVKMPSLLVPWAVLRREIHRAVRPLGVKPKNVLGVEGLAGGEGADTTNADEAAFLAKLERAFAGDPAVLPRFWLYAWDPAAERFALARPAEG